MHGFFINFPYHAKSQENSSNGKSLGIGSWENPKKPIVCGEPGKLVVILFP